MSHTPGPWTAGKTIKCTCEDPMSCWHYFSDQAEIFPPLGEAGPVAVAMQSDVDNASLIAAAPELLEALKRACDRLKAFPQHFDGYDTDMDEIERAIAKAEGKR